MMAFKLTFLFGIILGIMLIAYEDGTPLALYKKLRCFIGWHKMKAFNVLKYYCQFCRKPRKHPPLKLVDGKNKIRDNGYKF